MLKSLRNKFSSPFQTEAGPTISSVPSAICISPWWVSSAISGLQQGWALRYSMALQMRKGWVTLYDNGEQEAVTLIAKRLSYILLRQIVQDQTGWPWVLSIDPWVWSLGWVAFHPPASHCPEMLTYWHLKVGEFPGPPQTERRWWYFFPFQSTLTARTVSEMGWGVCNCVYLCSISSFHYQKFKCPSCTQDWVLLDHEWQIL